MEKKPGSKVFACLFTGVAVLAFVLAVAILPGGAQVSAQPGGKAATGEAVCQVTSINVQAGVVGAWVEATGQELTSGELRC